MKLNTFTNLGIFKATNHFSGITMKRKLTLDSELDLELDHGKQYLESCQINIRDEATFESHLSRHIYPPTDFIFGHKANKMVTSEVTREVLSHIFMLAPTDLP